MKPSFAALLVLAALALGGLVGATAGSGSYAISPDSQGPGVWRLDTRTGEVCAIHFEGMIEAGSVRVLACSK